MKEPIEAFQRWIKRFGSRPWQDELQKAFEAGYRAGAHHHDTMKAKPRNRNPRKIKIRTKPIEPKLDTLLERLKDQKR